MTHEYTLNNYHGADKENIYIPNTQDFINAGRISANDKVYITRDLMHNITVNGAVNVTVDDQGEKNKVYAKGDWNEAFGAYSTHLKSVDLSHVDTSGITNMFYLFLGSGDLKSVNFSGCDLSNVTNSTYMFAWAGGDMDDVNITGTKDVPRELLDKYIEVVRKTNKTTLDLSNITLSPHATDLSNLFANMPNVTSIDLTGWDTSNVTNMNSMFSNDPNLTTIKGLENWDTSKVTNMSFMFAGYHGNYWASPDSIGHLNKLDLSNWDTHNVKDMSFMFAGQSYLTSLGNLSHRGNKWNTGNVANMASMFYGLRSLPDGEFNLSNWDTSNVEDMSYMFTNMALQKDLNFVNQVPRDKVVIASKVYFNPGRLRVL